MTLCEYASKNKRYELLLEWDRSANKGIDPEKVSSSCLESVTWICKKGHRWNAAVKARTFRRTGCPYCAGQKAIPGETDLETMRPDLAKLWHPTLNGRLSPRDITAASHKKIWWRCERGHDWQAAVYSLNDGSGCPYCMGYKAIPGETDLATTHPRLVKEWDEEKNGALTPRDVSQGSAKNVWWRCEHGHSYQAFVYTRVAGSGCPYCAGKKVLAGFNDIATTDPELLADWDYERNRVKPTEINRGSHKKVWWKCELGHVYDAAPYTHVSGSGCPYCTGRKILAGFNDLATTHPKVAAQWEYTLNGELTPEMVTKGSNRKVWWKCSEGHVWQAAVFSRTRAKASDCPVCAGTVKRNRRARYEDDILSINRARTKSPRTASSGSVAV